jgi:zinc/manganese transport system substrate-binding protein
MKYFRIFFILASLPFLHAETVVCSFSITVVCSFSILKDLCIQLCQGIDIINVHTIVPNSADPHTYQPKPSDSKTLATADLVITNGLNLEGWIQNLIPGSGYKGNIIIASANVPARYLGKLPDPHIWHSPVLIILMIDNITKGLKEAFPQYASAFEKNAISLKATFRELQTNITALFLTIEQDKRVMLTTHDAFSYFAQCYNVKVLSPQGVSTSDDPSASDMKNLVNQIRQLEISAIFLENLSNPKILKTIACETRKKVSGVLYADTLKDDLSLQDTLWYNAVIIAEAMRGEIKNA